MTHRIRTTFSDGGDRPPATVPHPRPRRAGAFAWVMLAQLVAALLLGTPASNPARLAAPHDGAGIRPRDAVELALPHRRGDVTRELTPRLTHAPQSRAGGGVTSFVAATGWELAAAFSSTAPIEAAAPDPRGARRPAYYANAPPLSGRPST